MHTNEYVYNTLARGNFHDSSKTCHCVRLQLTYLTKWDRMTGSCWII